MGAVAIGFRSDNHWRSELELAVHQNTQLLVLGDVTLDPDDTDGATLSTPLFISGLAGLRVNF